MKNKNINLIRWFLFGPAVLATWYLMILVFAMVPHWIYKMGWNKILEYAEIPLAIVCGFLVPCIVVYFVAKYVAPNHKKTAGWVAVVFCVLWELFLMFGLSHLAY